MYVPDWNFAVQRGEIARTRERKADGTPMRFSRKHTLSFLEQSNNFEWKEPFVQNEPVSASIFAIYATVVRE